MESRQTLYDDWLTDFRKMLICFGVIMLSVVPGWGEPKAVSIAILVQSVSNIDNYWDFLKDKKIHKSLQNILLLIIVLSFATGIVMILSLGSATNYFEITKYHLGYIIKGLALFAVSFPVIVLFNDYKINRKYQEDEIVKEKDGGEEDEL